MTNKLLQLETHYYEKISQGVDFDSHIKSPVEITNKNGEKLLIL